MTDEKKVTVACASAKMTRFVKRAENLWKLRLQFDRLDEAPKDHLFHGYILWTPRSPSSPKTRVWEDRKIESILLIDYHEKDGYTILPQQEEKGRPCDARLIAIALKDFHKRHPRTEQIYVETAGLRPSMIQLFENEGFVEGGKGLMILTYGCEIDDSVLKDIIKTQNKKSGLLQDYVFDDIFPYHTAVLAIEETNCDIEIDSEEFDVLVQRIAQLSKPYQEKLLEESKKCVQSITKEDVLSVLASTTERQTVISLAFKLLNDHKSAACKRVWTNGSDARETFLNFIRSVCSSLEVQQNAISDFDIEKSILRNFTFGSRLRMDLILDNLAVHHMCIRLMSDGHLEKMQDRIRKIAKDDLALY